MLNQIKALLQDGQLRQKIKAAKTQDEVIELMATIAAEKGNNFTTEDVTQMLTKLAPGSGNELIELSESDLLAVAGGIRTRGRWPTARSVCYC
ncbi:MAG: Nif11 family protein [Pleurocapsa sp. MO_226.B13]|nr:Nif11 family protein [Pleurocapsa sp. MO_226.B13]